MPAKQGDSIFQDQRLARQKDDRIQTGVRDIEGAKLVAH